MILKGKLITLFFSVVVVVVACSAFNFPTDNGPPPAQPMMMDDTGGGLERQSITPAIVTPANSCVCVPTGQCNFGTVIGGNTDGTGLIDIRIVNQVG